MSRWKTPGLRALLIVMLLGVSLLPALARAQDAPVELLVWDQFTTPEESDAADAIYAGFTEANPNVTIRREAMQTEQMRTTVRTAMASGTGPDIIFYDAGPGYAGVLADAGLLTPLNDMANEYGWNERFAASALQGTTYDDQLVGLPLQTDLIGMYVNRTVMDEKGWKTPETVAELEEYCGKAKAEGMTPIAFADSEGWEAFHQFSMTANAMIGVDEMEKYLIEGEANWNSPEIISAIKTFFVDLPAAGCYTSDVNGITYEDGNTLFYSGDSAIHTTGSWLVGDIETNMPDADVEFVPFPQIEGAKGRYFLSGVGSAYMLSAASKHQDEAGQFLDYLFSPGAVEQWTNNSRYIVPVEVDPATITGPDLFKSINATLADAIANDTPLGYNIDVLAPQAFNDEMTNGFQGIIAGERTPEDVAAALQAAWEKGQAGQ